MSENEIIKDNYQSISDFYVGKSIFITGATGFLGKAYVEKILYSCPDIDKIYILVRDKKGLTSEERMQKYVDQPIFSRLKTQRPEAFKKLVPISGNLLEHNLGICVEDRNMLINNVSIVIHSAASIKFNDHLKITLKINVEGTRKVLNLAKEMKKIEMFVYVSTAYSNTNQKILEEKIYPQNISLKEVQKFADEHYILGKDDKEMKRFIGKHPNTYVFTKALAETFIAEEHGDIPTIIVRPSIIAGCAEGPMPGFVDSWSGATCMAVFAMKGWNHTVYCKGHEHLDMIPLDYVVNLTLVAIAKNKPSKEVKVYHSTTSDVNPISLRKIFMIIEDFASKHPTNHTAPLGATTLFTKQKTLIKMITFLTQTSPAFMNDLWMKTSRKKARSMKQISMVIKSRDQLEFFTSQSWVLQSKRACELSASLSDADRANFPCDPTSLNWDSYMRTYLNGIKKYLLKE